MAFIMKSDDPAMMVDSQFYPQGDGAARRGQPGAEPRECRLVALLVGRDIAQVVLHDPESTATTHVRLNRAVIARLAREMGRISGDPIFGWEPDPTTSWPNIYDKLIADTRAACACG